MKLAKFATQVDEKTLKEVRAHAKEQGKSISKIVTDALMEYLGKERVRPAFRSAADEVMNEHAELLERLAK